ncbi:MAG TPA: hypothetical protein VG734_07545 [Lacunisphaera sp.]|nr:hypothetical protein [Lacunisphaera sp.]
MKLLLLISVVLASLSPAHANTEVADVAVAVYHVAVSGGKSQPSESSPTGVSVLRDRFDVVERSLGIPLTKGHGLAVTFTLSGKYKRLESVRLVVTFPEMKSPSGEVYSRIDRIQKSLPDEKGRVVAFSYAFDEDWELVEGIWTVQIFDGKDRLGEAQLITFDPKKIKPNQRQSQRPCSSRLVLAHESRRSVPWLIFNDRQERWTILRSHS